MAILYLLGIRVFYVLVLIVSLFNEKAKLWIVGRKNVFRELDNKINDEDKWAWFHCASLGEFEQGRPVIEGFKTKFPDYRVLLTFFSPSGYEIRKNYELADHVCYLPLDTPGNAKKFMGIVKPKIAFFIKYEFWYFFLKEIGKKEIPLYLVSGIFRKNQRFFKRSAAFSKNMLSWFTHFFVQNEESEKLLQSVNFNNVSITGDTRFDRVVDITEQSKDLPLIEKFAGESLVVVAGSTWKADEELLFKFSENSQFSFKLIIAPHEIHKENIQRIIRSIPKDKKPLKYSEANSDNVLISDVLIIDSIGILSSVYKYGKIAYIGGGFGKGIHNILEAATFGLPIIFGPNHLQFKEAVDLKKLKGAYSIDNYDDLDKYLTTYINNSKEIEKSGKVCSNYVKENQGATNSILKKIKID